MDEFSFPRAQDSGSTSMNEDRDSDEEDLTPSLVPTSATPEIVTIQGEEDENLEDREQSPTHNVEALPRVQSLSPRTQSIMKMHPPSAILTPLHEGLRTRSSIHSMQTLCAMEEFVSLQEPKNI